MRDRLNNFEVSVVIPMYNEEEYIGECLKSVVCQDFDSYEIIVVDDGSTDNGPEIAEEILKASEVPYRIIRQKNRGVGQARNSGIENSNGRFIVFIDSDDWVKENHLKCLHGAVEGNDLAFTGLAKIDENKQIIRESRLENKSISVMDFIVLELEMKLPFNFCQIMYRKDSITQMFSKKAVYGEDTEFALKNIINSMRIGICSDITYFYRQHESSSTNNVSFRRFEFVQILEGLQSYFKDYPQLSMLIERNRIPKAIFGNMMYFIYNGYDCNEVLEEMERLDFYDKLEMFEGDGKFKLKTRLFLLNPKLYIKMWKKFKNSI